MLYNSTKKQIIEVKWLKQFKVEVFTFQIDMDMQILERSLILPHLYIYLDTAELSTPLYRRWAAQPHKNIQKNVSHFPYNFFR